MRFYLKFRFYLNVDSITMLTLKYLDQALSWLGLIDRKQRKTERLTGLGIPLWVLLRDGRVV